MPMGFVPIRVQDFISGSVASADVYICIEGTKYIKVLHRGQSFDPARLHNYEEFKVEMLYLKAEDFSHYVRDTAKLGAMLAVKPNVDPSTCIRFLNRVADTVFTELLHTEVRNESIEHVRAMNAQYLSGLQKKPNLTLVLNSLEELGSDFARHSIGVSLVATIMAMRLNWMGAKTIDIIQSGGLLHDIGFRELPPELCMKARAEMTNDEVKLYESHPFRGVQILQSVKTLPAEVIAIVYEHHEHSSGSGFPRGLKMDRVYPLARLISMADLYCHQALSSRFNNSPRLGVDVVDYLHGVYGRDYPYEYWDALDFMVGRDPLKVKKRA